MKIAIDCRMLNKSGIGVYLENILRELIPISSSHTFLLIGNPSAISFAIGNNRNCEILPCDIPIFSKDELVRFPARAINQCDAYYTPNFNIPRGIKIHMYSTIHDVAPLDVNITSCLGKMIRRYMYRRAIWLSAKIFTVSEFSKERILHHYRTSKKIIVTYNGISRQLKNHTIAPQSPYPFEYIVYVGNIKKHKGLHTLLEGFAMAQEQGMGKKLVIVGSSENFKTKDSKTVKFLRQQHDDIIFTGRVPDEMLYSIIAHAACLVQPSLYEGFGIPPLEALYLGCPAVVSDIPVFKEIYGGLPVQFFRTGDSGHLAEKMLHVQKIDAPVKLLQDRINKRFSYASSAKIVKNTISKINL
jgi:glycosyltransferase involved in cell wall biosynthesis